MKKFKVVLIPSNLDLSALVNEYEVKHQIDLTTCLEIVHYICTGKPEYVQVGGGTYDYAVAFHTKVARKKYGKGFISNITFLEGTGVIEMVVDYSTGHHPRCYKAGGEYEYSVLKPVEVPVQNRFSVYNETIDRATVANYPYLSKWFNENLTIDPAALVWLNKNYQKSLETAKSAKSKKRGRNKYSKRASSFYKIDKSYYSFTQDDFGFRLYNVFTNMDSKLRRFIKYNGFNLVGVDLKNSQPMMSIVPLANMLMNWDRITRLSDKRRIYNILTEPLGETGYKKFKQFILDHDLVDISNYIHLVSSGKIYEYIVEKYKEHLGIETNLSDEKKRKRAKLAMFNYLFSEPGHISKWTDDVNNITKIMKIEFPHVDEVFSYIKKNPLINMNKEGLPHRQFAMLLQSIESDLVLDKICYKISKEFPKIPIFTIHDSIVTIDNPECFIPIQTIILSSIRETIGITGVVKFDFFNPKSENKMKYGG